MCVINHIYPVAWHLLGVVGEDIAALRKLHIIEAEQAENEGMAVSGTGSILKLI